MLEFVDSEDPAGKKSPDPDPHPWIYGRFLKRPDPDPEVYYKTDPQHWYLNVSRFIYYRKSLLHLRKRMFLCSLKQIRYRFAVIFGPLCR